MYTTLQRPLVATYRLQLTPTFGFARAAELLDPVGRLGVSHLYLSPVAEAVPGSTHGYDVVDHRQVRAELGGEAALLELLDAAKARGMGIIIDHVPNHASVERAELNPNWWVTLRDGPTSNAASWFDIDWDSTEGVIIVPKLASPLAEVIEQGGISIVEGPDGHEIHYGTLRFPMADGTESLPVREAVERQHYRLTWWRSSERNVRRFFTIDDLVALCVEHPDVASEVDSIPRRLARHEAFAGVRVDHVDGLADPAEYLRGLRSTIGNRWLVVEKILAPDETLPRSWSVAGTTGYEQVTVAEHTLLDPSAIVALDGLWRQVSAEAGLDPSFERLEIAARREVLDGGLRPDLDRLVRTASRVVSRHVDELRPAIVELTLALDRYRTYLPDPESAGVLDAAERVAAGRHPEIAAAISEVATLIRTDATISTRWQQLTGPVMAKGAEDRAFYRHQRLSSLCEVGGSPGTWTLTVDEFHAHQHRVQSGWPTTMLTNTTHDTKRSAMVRARSLALAERSDRWAKLVASWLGTRPDVCGSLRPTDVSLALQTVATAWPLDDERLTDYLVKATREAELDTSWADPDMSYEAELRTLATALVAETSDETTALGRFAADLVERGSSIGLRLLALQLTCPGVPDLYQGAPTELLSLVDPDNRHTPDWPKWVARIEEAVDREGPVDLSDSDRARSQLVARVLAERRRHPSAFGSDAGYAPIDVTEGGAEHVVAFARLDAERRPATVTIVVRATATDSGPMIVLPDGRWHDVVHDSFVAPGATDVFTLTGDEGVAVLRRID